MNFDNIKDLVFNGRSNTTVTVRIDKKIERKRGDVCVSIVTEPEDEIYSVSFFKRRRKDVNISVPFVYK